MASSNFSYQGQTGSKNSANDCPCGFFKSLAVWIVVLLLALPPAHLLAASGVLDEPDLSGMVAWDPLPVFPTNVFEWKPVQRSPMIYPLDTQKQQSLEEVLSFTISSPRENLLIAPSEDDEWSPGLLVANDYPDGVAVSGSPVGGLAMLEQVVGNGVLQGEVSDATTLNPIENALVEIVGTGRTFETDAQGRFRFENLPPGNFTLEASQLGYVGETAVTTVVEGSPSEVRFGLRVKPSDNETSEFVLEEVTVVGEYQGDSRGDLLMNLELTSSIASGISKDDFTKSGVSDAGDAVSKIAGANIVGGKYAVVRGLGDRYSNTLVNGALISSADPSKKAVQLDLFPSDLLESVSIYKTFTPELPAEFAGGTVYIETLQFPEESIVKFEYGQKYNENLDGDFFTSGEDLGYFGKTDDALPSVIPPTGEFVSGETRRPNPTSATTLAAIEQAEALHMSSLLRPVKGKAKTPESFSLTLGKTFEATENLDIGVVFAGTSSNGSSAARDVTVGRSLNPGADGVSGTDDDVLNRTQVEDRYSNEAGYGILGSIGFRFKDRHQISFTGFENYSAQDDVTQARRIRDDTSGSGDFQDFAGPGTGQVTPFGATAATFQALDNITPLRRTLTLQQIQGNHEFGDEEHPFEIDWAYSQSDALEERPGTRTAFFSQLDFTDPRIQEISGAVYDPSMGEILTLSDVYGINPPLSQSFRETLSTTESATNRRIDLTIPVLNDGDDYFRLKVGGNDFSRSREVRGRFFTYNIGSRLNSKLATQDGGQFGIDYLNGFNGLTDPSGNPIFNGYANGRLSDGIYIEENTTIGNTVRNVDAATELTAAYLQTEIQVGSWEIVGGARFESEDRSFEILDGLNPAGTVVERTTISNDYVLPGITLKRGFGHEDEYLLSAAWSRTVARPTFFEFAPVRTQDQKSGDIFQGNPNLTDTLIDNFDLRWEWRKDAESFLAVSLFQKSLDSPIAQAYSLGDRTYINGEKGSLQGIEFEVSKRFLENWSLTSNFTYIDSQLEFEQPPSGLVSTTFDGQPNYIFNCGLGWDDEDLGLSATLNYNLTGSYLTAVPLGANEPPVRREAYSQLDLVIQKRFELGKGVGIVTLNFGNILGSVDTQVFDGTGLVYESFDPGRSYGLKLEYQF